MNIYSLRLALKTLIVFAAFFACKKSGRPAEELYRIEGAFKVNGLNRTYLVQLPPNYYKSDQFSLVLGFHGGGGTGRQFEFSSRLSEKAANAGFIAVYPDGTRGDGPLQIQTWNAGACCGQSSAKNIDDVQFVSQLIDTLISKYKIDRRKVFATGLSNGGMLSYRLACELSHKIAAIAPNGSTMVVNQACRPSRPVPILHMHSVGDEHVPYEGGIGNGISGIYNPPLDSVLNVWAANNFCNPVAVTENRPMYKITEWKDCRNNVSMKYYLTLDGGHAWPGGLRGSSGGDEPSSSINANDLLWEFFSQHSLP